MDTTTDLSKKWAVKEQFRVVRTGNEIKAVPCHTEHHWHVTEGALMIVLKDGHVHQTCCRCPATRTIHRDHASAA